MIEMPKLKLPISIDSESFAAIPMPQAPQNLHERISDAERTKTLTGFWRLLPFYLRRTDNGIKVHLFPWRILSWLLGCSVAAYFGGGIALYSRDRYYIGLKGISLVDRLYPPNWRNYAESRGDAYLAKAKESLTSGNFSNAFHQVKAGLSRSPKNLEGRLLYSEMLQVAGRADLGEAVLIEGLEFHSSDLDYVGKTVAFLFRYQKDASIIELGNRLLKTHQNTDSSRPERTSNTDNINNLLAKALANAYFYRGNFDQAENVIAAHQLTSTPDGRLLTAKIEWERGYRLLALALMEQLSKEFPENPSFYQTVVRWQISESLTDTARRTSLLRRLSFPDQFQPRIDLLYAYHKSGESRAATLELEEYFRDFAKDEPAILVLGDFAANTGDHVLAKRIFDYAGTQNFSRQAPALMLVEANIVGKNYETAIKLARDLIEKHPEWERQFAPVFNGLQAIANFALGRREEASLYLNSFLNLPSVRAENLVAVAQRLQSVGAKAESHRVLVHAIQADPLNQPALARLIEYELADPESPELMKHLERLLEMRRPSPELLKAAYVKLGLDRYMFTADRNELMDNIAVVLSGRVPSSK